MTEQGASANTVGDVGREYIEKLAGKIYDYFTQPGKPTLSPELGTRFPGFASIVGELRSNPAPPPREDAVERIITQLRSSPERGKLQQALSYLVNYVPSRWLLEKEYSTIKAIREIHSRSFEPWDESGRSIYEWASRNSLTGLCMSGGGIRSATFNLGILQGLASKRWIGSFDYISSVSGGGYIHTWFAAWLKREFDRRKAQRSGTVDESRLMREALSQVEADLTPLTKQPTKWTWRTPAFKEETLDTSPGADVADNQRNFFSPREIKWLRSYSNYLTPRTGLLTMDTWSALSVWLRNTFLNQLVLIAALVFCLALVHLFSDQWKKHLREPVLEQKNEVTLKGSASTTGMGQVASLSFSLIGKTEKPESAKFSWHRFTGDYAGIIHKAITDPPCPALNPFEVAQRGQCGKNSECEYKVVPYLSFLGLCLIAVFGFAWASWRFHGILSAEWDRVHKCDVEKQKREEDPEGQPPAPDPKSSQTMGELSLKKKTEWKLFLAVLMLTAPGLPLAYWILYTPLGRATPLAVFVALTFLGLCGAFGGRPLADLSIYGFEDGKAGSGQQPKAKIFQDKSLLGAWLIISAILSGLMGGTIYVAIAALIRTALLEQWGSGVIQHAEPSVELAFGVPLLMWLPFLTIIILTGLVGHNLEDWVLELVARARARSLLLAGGALVILSAALLSPDLTSMALGGIKIKVSAILAWVAMTLAGVLSGKSDKTDGKPSSSEDKSKKPITPELIATVGPYAYLAGLLIGLAALAQACLGRSGSWAAFSTTVLVFGGIALLFGWQLDATKFSMYPFYRDRLTRCYLGASNRDRMPSPLTGFDNRDTFGLQLKNFTPAGGYAGPLPIFSATLNLTTGEDLATQERKGASFAFTPLYSGYTVGWTEGADDTNFNGFVRTSEYALPGGGLNIAAAMAISGAALSPNWGYHSKPATAFLLTMFNARLGRWLPNPRKASVTARTASVWRGFPGFLQLVYELMGHSDDSQEFVYLSDGGHFDNMGLYELVRRRCSRIVICDAEEDSGYLFSGIGMAIRKCRIDFGAEIELDLSNLRLVAKTKFSAAHTAKGFITYPDTPSERGEILYIKSSLIPFPPKPDAASPGADPGDLPDVPGDVQNYWLEHGTFPHDSTVDQWFTESQFESYRRLGQSVIENISGTLL